jgi:hypothetical protein
MDKKHPHAAALDRIGAPAIISQFGISRQGLWKWRRYGVPKLHHGSLRLLATIRGVQVPELAEGEAK